MHFKHEKVFRERARQAKTDWNRTPTSLKCDLKHLFSSRGNNTAKQVQANSWIVSKCNYLTLFFMCDIHFFIGPLPLCLVHCSIIYLTNPW